MRRCIPGSLVTSYLLRTTASADAYHDKLVTIFSAHDGSIDVFDSDVIWQAQWAPAQWAAQLDKAFPPSAQKNYVQAMITADTVDGHIYGIPWLFDVGHLFYRTDILDAEWSQARHDLAANCVEQCVMLEEEISDDDRVRRLRSEGSATDLQFHGIRLGQRRGHA